MVIAPIHPIIPFNKHFIFYTNSREICCGSNKCRMTGLRHLFFYLPHLGYLFSHILVKYVALIIVSVPLSAVASQILLISHWEQLGGWDMCSVIYPPKIGFYSDGYQDFKESKILSGTNMHQIHHPQLSPING